MNYWETPLYALRLAEGRLAMLLDADLPESDHPSATQYVLDKVRIALAAGAGTAETNEDLAQSEGRQSGGDSRNAQPLSDRIEQLNQGGSK